MTDAMKGLTDVFSESSVIVGAVSFAGVVITMFTTLWVQRRTNRQNAKKLIEDNQASIHSVNVTSLQTTAAGLMEQINSLREDVRSQREEADQRILRLENKLDLITNGYYQLLLALNNAVNQLRTLKFRLKDLDPNIDLSEFPEIKVEDYDLDRIMDM